MLRVNSLVGFGARRGGPSAASVTLTDQYSFNTEPSPDTETSASIGAAAADRLVLVAISGNMLSSWTARPNAVTIGGVSATELVGISNSEVGALFFSTIWAANVPSGTTANIVVSWPGGGCACSVQVYAVYGASATPADTGTHQTNTGLSVSTTLDITENSITVATAIMGVYDATPEITWTNITERTQQLSFLLAVSGASRTDEAAPGSTTITCTSTEPSPMLVKQFTIAGVVLQPPT